MTQDGLFHQCLMPNKCGTLTQLKWAEVGHTALDSHSKDRFGTLVRVILAYLSSKI